MEVNDILIPQWEKLTIPSEINITSSLNLTTNF